MTKASRENLKPPTSIDAITTQIGVEPPAGQQSLFLNALTELHGLVAAMRFAKRRPLPITTPPRDALQRDNSSAYSSRKVRSHEHR